MNRSRPLFEIARHLSLVLAVFIALTPAFASPVMTHTIQLCSGLDVIAKAVSGEDGKKNKEKPGHCLFCTGRHFILSSDVSIVPAPRIFTLSTAFAFESVFNSLFLASDYQSRAPPALLI